MDYPQNVYGGIIKEKEEGFKRIFDTNLDKNFN